MKKEKDYQQVKARKNERKRRANNKHFPKNITMARLLLTLLLTCTLYMVVNLKITSLNIRAGFRNKIDDILANYGGSDLICLQKCCHMDTSW